MINKCKIGVGNSEETITDKGFKQISKQLIPLINVIKR